MAGTTPQRLQTGTTLQRSRRSGQSNAGETRDSWDRDSSMIQLQVGTAVAGTVTSRDNSLNRDSSVK